MSGEQEYSQYQAISSNLNIIFFNASKKGFIPIDSLKDWLSLFQGVDIPHFFSAINNDVFLKQLITISFLINRHPDSFKNMEGISCEYFSNCLAECLTKYGKEGLIQESQINSLLTI